MCHSGGFSFSISDRTLAGASVDAVTDDGWTPLFMVLALNSGNGNHMLGRIRWSVAAERCSSIGHRKVVDSI